MGRGPARPIKVRVDGPARPGSSISQTMGRGPAPPGPDRPGPSNFHMGRGPSNFQDYRPGPARSITFSKLSAQPGPAHHIIKIVGPARPAFSAHDMP